MDVKEIAKGYAHILSHGLGIKWKNDEHLKETPMRAAKALVEVLGGYDDNPIDHLKLFPESDYKGMLVIGPIKIFSLCAHHLLPFTGDIYIGVVYNDQIMGISKFVRIARSFSKKLQVQERITEEIADFLDTELNPKGVIVVIKNSEHLCMKARGVKDPCANVTTSSVKGVFANNENNARSEFLELIK